jgi:protein arginine kinase
MLSLPALSLSGEMPSLIPHLHSAGLSVRPLGQDTDHALGFLYRISLCPGAGVDEQTVCTNMEKAVRQIIDAERSGRKTLPTDLTEQLMDSVARSEGILKCSRTLSVNEFIQRSSYIRLGIALGWVDDIRIETLNALLIEVMPATLTMASETPPNSQSEQDKLRASVVRERLTAV